MLWNYLNFFVALLELHWIYYLTKFGCWMRLPCHRELHGNVGNFWISMYISDIHGYPWISMDFHGLPWVTMDCHRYPLIFSRIENILGYPWIQEICKSMGNPKYFGYPREIQIIIGFPTRNAKLEKRRSITVPHILH